MVVAMKKKQISLPRFGLDEIKHLLGHISSEIIKIEMFYDVPD